jgi:hypothetical protein
VLWAAVLALLVADFASFTWGGPESDKRDIYELGKKLLRQ